MNHDTLGNRTPPRSWHPLLVVAFSIQWPFYLILLANWYLGVLGEMISNDYVPPGRHQELVTLLKLGSLVFGPATAIGIAGVITRTRSCVIVQGILCSGIAAGIAYVGTPLA
jgi:hypothetical protein